MIYLFLLYDIFLNFSVWNITVKSITKQTDVIIHLYGGSKLVPVAKLVNSGNIIQSGALSSFLMVTKNVTKVCINCISSKF